MSRRKVRDRARGRGPKPTLVTWSPRYNGEISYASRKWPVLAQLWFGLTTYMEQGTNRLLITPEEFAEAHGARPERGREMFDLLVQNSILIHRPDTPEREDDLDVYVNPWVAFAGDPNVDWLTHQRMLATAPLPFTRAPRLVHRPWRVIRGGMMTLGTAEDHCGQGGGPGHQSDEQGTDKGVSNI